MRPHAIIAIQNYIEKDNRPKLDILAGHMVMPPGMESAVLLCQISQLVRYQL